MTKDEALKLALEKFEFMNHVDSIFEGEFNLQINAIKEALMSVPDGAQPSVSVEQEPVAHSVVAGALFDFMGWLTSRNKRLTLSGADEASPAVEAIQEFSEKRGLSLKDAEVGFWTEFLSTPPQRKPLTDEEIGAILEDINAFGTRLYTFARDIEAAHGIKENT
jgi:hypothetical protein